MFIRHVPCTTKIPKVKVLEVQYMGQYEVIYLCDRVCKEYARQNEVKLEIQDYTIFGTWNTAYQ